MDLQKDYSAKQGTRLLANKSDGTMNGGLVVSLTSQREQPLCLSSIERKVDHYFPSGVHNENVVNKFNFNAIRQDLANINWDKLYRTQDVNHAMLFFILLLVK